MCKRAMDLRTRLQPPVALGRQRDKDFVLRRSQISVSQTNALQGPSARIVGSGIYNSGVKIFSDVPLGIDLTLFPVSSALLPRHAGYRDLR